MRVRERERKRLGMEGKRQDVNWKSVGMKKKGEGKRCYQQKKKKLKLMKDRVLMKEREVCADEYIMGRRKTR